MEGAHVGPKLPDVGHPQLGDTKKEAQVKNVVHGRMAACTLTGVPRPCYRHMFAQRRSPGPANRFFRRSSCLPSNFAVSNFIQYDSLLTDEERLVRDTTRQFIEDNLVPIIEECNRAGRFPRELVKPMADLGFFGASLKGYGCAGMGNVEYGLMTQELERGDSGVRSFVSVQSGLCMYPIYEFGSEEQKETWLPPMQKGEKLGCFGLTEPDFGSNPGGMRTRAKKVGNEYVLNGEKMWITSGTIADVAIIWAKVENEKDKIRGFLVETDRPGFKADDIHGKWSLRASVTSGLALQDVHIPEANLLPKTGGLKSPLMCLNQASHGGRLARPWPAMTVRCNIRCCENSGAISPSLRTSSCKTSSRG